MFFYSLEGQHLWHQVLKCVMLLEIHVFVTVLSLSSWFPSVFCIWLRYCKEILQILLPVKLNPIAFFDINVSLATATATSGKWTKNRHMQQNVSAEHFSAASLTKNDEWPSGLNAKFILISVDHLTVHHGSAKKKKRVASCKFLMLLHQGSAHKTCLSCWMWHSLLQLVSRSYFDFHCLQLIGPSAPVFSDIYFTRMSSCLSNWFALFKLIFNCRWV